MQAAPEAGVRPRRLLLAHDLRELRDRLGTARLAVDAEPVEQPDSEANQRAARRGRRVRFELVAEERGAHRPPLDDPVVGQVLGR